MGMKRIQEKCFLLNGFLLSSLAPLYGKTFNYFLLFMIIVHAVVSWNSFVKDLQVGKRYLFVFVIYFVYISLQTLFITWNPAWDDKTYYGIFEDLLLNFILVPVYVVSLKECLTPRLLARFLLLFCTGCLLLNLYIVYDLVGKGLFLDTSSAIDFLYTNRFGENKLALLGGNLYLEPQTLYIALAALITYFLIFVYKNKVFRIFLVLMFLLFTFFLSFTVTKAGILAFILGFIIINFYIFKRCSLRTRWVMLVGMVSLVPVFGIFVSDGLKGKYEERTEEIVREVENVKQGIYAGGTIAPRIGFIRESFIHIDEFGVWGLGVYAKSRVNNWLQSSEVGLSAFTNVHNSFLHYWIQGGILGLLMIVFLFCAPFYQMLKNRRICWLICALTVIIFVMNNTCILLALNNSRLMILLLLAMFYFHEGVFQRLEREER